MRTLKYNDKFYEYFRMLPTHFDAILARIQPFLKGFAKNSFPADMRLYICLR